MSTLPAPPIVHSPAPVWIVRPARTADIDEIVALHREAFADKFGGAFGAQRIAQGAAALAHAWKRQGSHALQGMLVAEYQEQIIGTLTLRTWEMGEDDAGITEMAFQQELGVWGALRSLFVLSLLSHRIAHNEGFVTDVAVLETFRRRGVARDLLQHATQQAIAKRKRYLALYVGITNTAANTLYNAHGFHRERTRTSWLTRLFFGQRVWLYMRKELCPPPDTDSAGIAPTHKLSPR